MAAVVVVAYLSYGGFLLEVAFFFIEAYRPPVLRLQVVSIAYRSLEMMAKNFVVAWCCLCGILWAMVAVQRRSCTLRRLCAGVAVGRLMPCLAGPGGLCLVGLHQGAIRAVV